MYNSTLLAAEATKEEIQKADLDLLKKINEVSSSIDASAILPIGYIYTQYPGQKTPDELFGTKSCWENISSLYAGDFFRAEGGTYALPFGAGRQDYDWKSFWMTDTGQNTSSYSHNDVYMGKSTTAYVGNLFTGSWAAPAAAIGTKWSTEEPRPTNQTIRIWKKIKSALETQEIDFITPDATVFAAARYGAVSSTAGTPWVMTTPDEDKWKTLTLATGRFTAPKAGIYSITGYTNRQTAAGGTMSLYKNGVSFMPLVSWVGATYTCAFSTTIRLLKDEYVDIRPDGTVLLYNAAIQFTLIGV